MSLIPITRNYTFLTTGSFQTTASYTGLSFNTDTHTIVQDSGSSFLALLDPRPTNITTAAGTLLWFECAPDFTQTSWFYAGGTATTTSTIANSVSCGWAPPDPPANTCDLVLHATVSGDIIMATTSGAHGAVTYSIDGGTTRQASGTFADVAPGAYVVTAYDAGAPSCSRSTTVSVVATSPGLLPVPGALPEVAFAGNPIALLGKASRPGRPLLLELFVETAHGNRDYRRVVQRLRPTDTTGSTVVELQAQLAAVLQPALPDLSLVTGLRRRTDSIRRYYAALAEILPGTGAAGPFVFGAPRTVLAGKLSWSLARAGTFFSPLPGRFMSWRPAGIPAVGAEHVVLLSALIPASTTSCTLKVGCYQLGEQVPFQVVTHTLPMVSVVENLGEGNIILPSLEVKTLDPPTPFLVESMVHVASLPDMTYRFSVQLFGQEEAPLTDLRTYRIERAGVRHEFMFWNSLGSFETLSCFGLRTSKTVVERTVATTLQPPDYDPRSGPSRVVTLMAEDRTTVSTGLVAPAELHWLRELLTSQHVYEVVAGQLRKIVLLTKEINNYQQDGGSEGFSFEYQYAYDSTPYEALLQ